jgi:DNA-binding response OmpR family regulator
MTDKVLIIEGNSDLRKSLAATLTEATFEVEGVANYYEALWQLGEFKPDIVILNEKLPLISGWEACYQLSQTFAIPVIIMGEKCDEEVWVMALKVGADFYLKSPFSHLELIARIDTIIWRYRKEKVWHHTY